MSKQECVKRARNLNHQAIQDERSGRRLWASQCRKKRDELMRSAREV